MIKLKTTFIDETITEIIVPTIFPDNTSQVWKVKSIQNNYSQVLSNEILWQYENEAELFHVCQLSDLLDSYKGDPRPLKVLNIPYMPYGRQDKPILNHMTFAQISFAKVINSLNFDRVISFDVHGTSPIKNLQRISANKLIKSVFDNNGYEVYCYPDGGACERYLHEPSINGVKVRDKNTGKIQEYLLQTDGVEIAGKKILIADDICDGGATFIELMALLKEHNVGEVGLYVSHGLFSKGKEALIEAGVSKFYYTNSLPKNEEDGIKIV